MRAPFFNGAIAHRFLPVGLRESGRGWLHRALDEQAPAVAPLRRASDLAPLPEQVELLGAEEALAGQFPAAARGKLRRDTQPVEGAANPFVDRLIAFRGAQGMPPV